ncbi:MAG: branched-chain amino acid ABC transporter permease, partial [Actinomycetota bacterium]
MSNSTASSHRTTRGRPQLFTSYAQETAIFNTRVKRNWVLVGILVMLVLPFFMQRDMVALITT